MDTVRLIGTGSYVPPKVLTNFDLEKMGLDTSDEWIVQRTGISERRIADPTVTNNINNDPTGPASDLYRVIRGGAYNSSPFLIDTCLQNSWRSVFAPGSYTGMLDFAL